MPVKRKTATHLLQSYNNIREVTKHGEKNFRAVNTQQNFRLETAHSTAV